VTTYRLAEQKPCPWNEPCEVADFYGFRRCVGCNGDRTRWVLTDRTIDLDDEGGAS
jgi:hypothetical protein